MLFMVFAFHAVDTGGITDGSKRLFMESDIDPMDSEEILQEGKAGSASVEEWVGASTPSDGGPSIFEQMGGVQNWSRPS